MIAPDRLLIVEVTFCKLIALPPAPPAEPAPPEVPPAPPAPPRAIMLPELLIISVEPDTKWAVIAGVEVLVENTLTLLLIVRVTSIADDPSHP
tara:strand:+ start:358 stop:636 length:279 start_codon:yes stop_codon:yes gene_type:complete